MKKLWKLSTLVLASTLIINGCASKSGGGDSGESGPSDAQINAEAAKAYAEVKSKSKLSTNARWNEIVQRVSKKIAAASGEPFDWEVVLIDNPEPNAWCMPGGKMAVYTGILPILENEGALAAVMGHEVAHATQRHGKEQYVRAMKPARLGGLVLAAGSIIGGQLLCKSQSCKILTGLGGAAAGLAVTFFDMKFSREDETEADQAGQIFMARAGYDPAEAIKVWERMEKKAGKGGMPEFASTHPKNERRRNNLQAWLPDAQRTYSQSPDKLGTGERL